MVDLIVGPTTHDSTTLWVRGADHLRHARLRLEGDGAQHVEEIELRGDRDFTGAVTIGGLAPCTRYDVEARFRPGRAEAHSGEEIVQGRLRTFPPRDHEGEFSFLHGSCNLSIVSLTNVGALAAGALGAIVAAKSFERSGPRPHAWVLTLAKAAGNAFMGARLAVDVMRARLGGPKPREFASVDEQTLVLFLFSIVYGMTGFKQPKPVFPSPFARLRKLLDEESPPSFMIHAGDQIYYDFPFAARKPDEEAYRLAYREAWFEDALQREFLARCPNYMILDDHEIVDRFARDYVPGRVATPRSYLQKARPAYEEYVNSRQNGSAVGGPYWYEFSHGAARFLVLDTRTERKRGEKRMLDEAQLAHLIGWLTENRDRIKFVVSSVPFLAELRPEADEQGGGGEASHVAVAEEDLEERDDKWSGRPYRRQRDQILDEIYRNEIDRLVFLVGDMHCTYHATMRLGSPRRRVTLHELAGGPIHQVEFASRSKFRDQVRGSTCVEKVPFRTWFQAFLGAATGVLRVSVLPGDPPELRWKVVRTGAPHDREEDFRSLAGRIAF